MKCNFEFGFELLVEHSENWDLVFDLLKDLKVTLKRRIEF